MLWVGRNNDVAGLGYTIFTYLLPIIGLQSSLI